jgi:3-deoxy-D-manno-octulosonate 8-phosphate phosphatase (KDO 8-P phosphatase)
VVIESNVFNPPNMNLTEAFSRITAFVLDMDGVLTDGSLIILPGGEYIRTMNIKDGYGLQLAVKKGYHVMVITGSASAPAEERLAYLGIKEIHHRVSNKKELLLQLMEKYALQPENVLYMGDDMPDLEAMQTAGLATCPADAVAEIKGVSHYISPVGGGMGCVRDVVEKVLKIRGHWQDGAGTASL